MGKPFTPTYALPTLACLSMAASPLLSAESVTSSIGLKFYGIIKVDAIHETTETEGAIPKWVRDTDNDDGSFYMTARQTRLGLNLTGPSTNGIKTTGKLEIDFYGGGNDDSNKAEPRMRHAYVQAEWEESGFKLLAGQFWDLLSPEIASTVHFGPLWWAGDIGFRRPQIRLSKATTPAPDHKLDLAVAITGNTGNMDAESPGLQASAIYQFPLMDKKAKLSLSGQVNSDKDGAQSNAINFGFHIPFGQFWTKGGVWTGQNLADYLGGVGQNGTDGNEVEAVGGWIQLGVKLQDSPWKFHIGYSMDDPDDDNLADGARDLNSNIHGNVFYSLTPQMSFALEIYQLTTEYVNGEDRDSNRIQFATMYKF